MANKKEIDWKWGVTTGIVVIGIVGGGAWKLGDEFSKIDKHISRVETAVRILGAKQGGDTKTLIDEALTVAKNAAATGHLDNAKAIVAYTNQLLAEQKQSRIEASPHFFERTLQSYQSLTQSTNLRESAHAGTLLLAEYRSALQPQPELPKKTDTALTIQTTTTGSPKVILQSGNYLLHAPVHARSGIDFVGEGAATVRPDFTDRDMLIPDTKRWETNHVTVSGVNVVDGSQSLDGFIWENVTFANMRIRYAGGTALFHNVRFVNCTFDLPSDNMGMSIADYVALGRTDELRIG